jgi:hypothetical protein
MAQVRVFREQLIKATPDVVYDCIADYTNHHGNILPKEFHDLRVESGPGRGAGTVISFKMTMMGSTRGALCDITEPEPGRVLVETDRNTGLATTFTVDPAEGGSRVSFDTVWEPKGVQGLVERLMAKRLLLPVYEREMAKLEAYAQSRMTGPAGTA